MLFGKSLNRFVATFVSNEAMNGQLMEGMAALSTIGITHQYQQSRSMKKIHFCGYLEYAPHKKRDIRYKTATWHDTKRMTWHDYQNRSFRAVHWRKQYPLWQAKMDYAENLCRLGMPSAIVEHITKLHPHCIKYIERKLSGNVELLHEAQWSNYVNHKQGQR